MFPLGSISPVTPSPLTRIEAAPRAPERAAIAAPGTPPGESFGQLLDGVVASVDARQTAAQDVTRQVLLGQNDQLHQSIIAMQEASVSFSMMIEVRNKLVESYQELMRMQV